VSSLSSIETRERVEDASEELVTCIVGFVEGNTVWMGGDSAGTSLSLDQDLYDAPKVFRNGPMLIGTSGNARQGDLLRWVLTVPEALAG
jgi:hypothetical protein